MPEGTSNSVINLGDLSKPADTLIKKVSKAVGGIFQPGQIVRIAKAEAAASLIKANTEIQITDLHRRAMHRFVEEEAIRQRNMEEITAGALPQLTAEAKPEDIEDDWLTNFFEKCRIVSDQEMQKLWSRVLAGEAEAKGRFSKRTVNFLSDLDKTDAEMFSKLCRFIGNFGKPTVLVFEIEHPIYKNNGIDFLTLSHLESIGLIQYTNTSTFSRIQLPKLFLVSYQGKTMLLRMPFPEGNALEIGNVLLTKVGEEISSVCESKPIDDFYEYLENRWKLFVSSSIKVAAVDTSEILSGTILNPPEGGLPVWI
jgi:hypothetical protein